MIVVVSAPAELHTRERMKSINMMAVLVAAE